MATLYLFHPLQHLRNGRRGIPILMYHSITEAANDDRHPYYQTTTSPRVFEEHLNFLRENRYEVIDLNDALGYCEPSASVAVITFDDGFEDFYAQAAPLLAEFHYPSTVFLPTAYIGDSAPRRFKGTKCMTWNQVRELKRAGVTFGSHTVTHPQLRKLNADGVREEVCRSKETIEDKLGSAVKSFAYPYAFPEADRAFKGRLNRILAEAGYENGVCTSVGMANPGNHPFFLRRLPVNSWDDGRLFKAKLEGGYDWLQIVQKTTKSLSILGDTVRSTLFSAS